MFSVCTFLLYEGGRLSLVNCMTPSETNSLCTHIKAFVLLKFSTIFKRTRDLEDLGTFLLDKARGPYSTAYALPVTHQLLPEKPHSKGQIWQLIHTVVPLVPVF